MSTIVTATVPPPEPQPPGADQDQQLLDAARAGDDGAFAQLIERQDPLLSQLATGMLDGEGADELLIESYVRAYRALSRQRDHALAWLVRTTYLTCLAEARRRDRRRRGGPGRLPERTASPVESPLGATGPDERAALLLLDGAELDPDLVAIALGAPARTVQALAAHARAIVPEGVDLTRSTEHDPAFWATLGRRLLAEREAPAVPVPDLPSAGEARRVSDPVKPPPVAMQRRAPRSARRRRREEDAVEGLAIEAKRQRPRRSPGRLAGRAAVALLVLVVLVAAIYVVVRNAAHAHSPVRTNSVSQLSQGTIAALEVPSLAMTYVRTVVPPRGRAQATRYSLLRAADGSFVLIDISSGRTDAYDAGTATWRSRGPGAAASEQTGLGAGPPDNPAGDPGLPDAELDRALRTLSTVTDAAGRQVTVNGTPAWLLQGSLPAHDLGADRVELTVDQAQFLPISVEFFSGSRLVREVRFDSVTLNAPTPGPFTIDLSGAAVTPVDRGFRPSDLAGTQTVTGYAPLRPSYLPSGFELTATTVRSRGGIVTVRYQRGFQQIVLSTRASPVRKGHRWADPFGRAADVDTTDVTIGKGLYRGTIAQQADGLGSEPQLWGTDGRIAFTITGDATADQLVQMAESLH